MDKKQGFKCVFCHKRFKDEFYLEKHRKKRHPEEEAAAAAAAGAALGAVVDGGVEGGSKDEDVKQEETKPENEVVDQNNSNVKDDDKNATNRIVIEDEVPVVKGDDIGVGKDDVAVVKGDVAVVKDDVRVVGRDFEETKNEKQRTDDGENLQDVPVVKANRESDMTVNTATPTTTTSLTEVAHVKTKPSIPTSITEKIVQPEKEEIQWDRVRSSQDGDTNVILPKRKEKQNEVPTAQVGTPPIETVSAASQVAQAVAVSKETGDHAGIFEGGKLAMSAFDAVTGGESMKVNVNRNNEDVPQDGSNKGQNEGVVESSEEARDEGVAEKPTDSEGRVVCATSSSAVFPVTEGASDVGKPFYSSDMALPLAAHSSRGTSGTMMIFPAQPAIGATIPEDPNSPDPLTEARKTWAEDFPGRMTGESSVKAASASAVFGSATPAAATPKDKTSLASESFFVSPEVSTDELPTHPMGNAAKTMASAFQRERPEEVAVASAPSAGRLGQVSKSTTAAVAEKVEAANRGSKEATTTVLAGSMKNVAKMMAAPATAHQDSTSTESGEDSSPTIVKKKRDSAPVPVDSSSNDERLDGGISGDQTLPYGSNESMTGVTSSGPNQIQGSSDVSGLAVSPPSGVHASPLRVSPAVFEESESSSDSAVLAETDEAAGTSGGRDSTGFDAGEPRNVNKQVEFESREQRNKSVDRSSSGYIEEVDPMKMFFGQVEKMMIDLDTALDDKSDRIEHLAFDNESHYQSIKASVDSLKGEMSETQERLGKLHQFIVNTLQKPSVPEPEPRSAKRRDSQESDEIKTSSDDQVSPGQLPPNPRSKSRPQAKDRRRNENISAQTLMVGTAETKSPPIQQQQHQQPQQQYWDVQRQQQDPRSMDMSPEGQDGSRRYYVKRRHLKRDCPHLKYGYPNFEACEDRPAGRPGQQPQYVGVPAGEPAAHGTPVKRHGNFNSNQRRASTPSKATGEQCSLHPKNGYPNMEPYDNAAMAWPCQPMNGGMPHMEPETFMGKAQLQGNLNSSRKCTTAHRKRERASPHPNSYPNMEAHDHCAVVRPSQQPQDGRMCLAQPESYVGSVDVRRNLNTNFNANGRSTMPPLKTREELWKATPIDKLDMEVTCGPGVGSRRNVYSYVDTAYGKKEALSDWFYKGAVVKASPHHPDPIPPEERYPDKTVLRYNVRHECLIDRRMGSVFQEKPRSKSEEKNRESKKEEQERKKQEKLEKQERKREEKENKKRAAMEKKLNKTKNNENNNGATLGRKTSALMTMTPSPTAGRSFLGLPAKVSKESAIEWAQEVNANAGRVWPRPSPFERRRGEGESRVTNGGGFGVPVVDSRRRAPSPETPAEGGDDNVIRPPTAFVRSRPITAVPRRRRSACASRARSLSRGLSLSRKASSTGWGVKVCDFVGIQRSGNEDPGRRRRLLTRSGGFGSNNNNAAGFLGKMEDDDDDAVYELLKRPTKTWLGKKAERGVLSGEESPEDSETRNEGAWAAFARGVGSGTPNSRRQASEWEEDSTTPSWKCDDEDDDDNNGGNRNRETIGSQYKSREGSKSKLGFVRVPGFKRRDDDGDCDGPFRKGSDVREDDENANASSNARGRRLASVGSWGLVLRKRSRSRADANENRRAGALKRARNKNRKEEAKEGKKEDNKKEEKKEDSLRNDGIMPFVGHPKTWHPI